MSGWIKLHRELLDWEWAGEPNVLCVFIHLLLSANFNDKKWKGEDVKRGQLVTSVKSLSQATGLSIQQVRSVLNKLEMSKNIDTFSTNKYTLVTIVKYDDFQDQGVEDNKQITTPKENKNKETNNVDIIPPKSPKGTSPKAKVVDVDWDKFVARWKELTGKTIRKTDTLKKLVSERIKDGYTKVDIDLVIRAKAKEWKNDPRMSKYLRIKTIFAKSNFEEYINEAEEIKEDLVKAAEKEKKFKEMEELRKLMQG